MVRSLQWQLSAVIFTLMLLSIPFATAQSVLLQTSMSLDPSELWTGTVHVEDGDLNITLSKDSGDLNLTILQNNEQRLVAKLNSSISTLSQIVTVNEGLINITAQNIETLLTIKIDLKLTQSVNNFDGIMIGLGALIFLLLPFAYMLGKYRSRGGT